MLCHRGSDSIKLQGFGKSDTISRLEERMNENMLYFGDFLTIAEHVRVLL